jgi:hypothetical protein
VTVASFLLLAAIGLALVSALVLRSVGSGLRIGRLLAGTRPVGIGEAIELATSEPGRYVRVTGRISSDEEFPDDQNRPLVFRRTRLDIKGSGDRAWRTVFDEREAVPFGVESRSDYIGIDDVALADGLVVIPRVSLGVVGDLPADFGADLPPGTDPTTPARLTIDQLSAVEHATAVGRIALRQGVPSLTADTGKPLIVTTLDQSAAMRLLARGKRQRVVSGAVGLAVALGLLAGAIAAYVVGI